MVEVAPLTATAEGPLATITATSRRTKSVAIAGRTALTKRFDRFGIHVDAKQM